MDYFVTITAFSHDDKELTSSERQPLPPVQSPKYDGFTGENLKLETDSISWDHDQCVEKYSIDIWDRDNNKTVEEREVENLKLFSKDLKVFQRFWLKRRCLD